MKFNFTLFCLKFANPFGYKKHVLSKKIHALASVIIERCQLKKTEVVCKNTFSLTIELSTQTGVLFISICKVILIVSKLHVILQGAAAMAGKKVTVLRQAGAACDHPIDPSYPEGAYLSNIMLRVL